MRCPIDELQPDSKRFKSGEKCEDFFMVTKSTNECIFTTNPMIRWHARANLEDAGSAEEHIITESAPNKPERLGGR